MIDPDRQTYRRIEVRDRVDSDLLLHSLKADPLWERDFITDDWHKRTLEFLRARRQAEDALPEQRRSAEIALGVALLELATSLPPQTDGAAAEYTETGARYEVVASVHEGEISTHYSSADSLRAWKERLLAYVAAHPGDFLVWRERPEIYAWMKFDETRPTWKVYSRLVIE